MALSRKSPASLDPERLIIQGLTFLAADAEEAQRFFSWSGLEPASLRQAVGEPGFARGFVDYLLQNLEALERFAAQAGLEPAQIVAWHERQSAEAARRAEGH